MKNAFYDKYLNFKKEELIKIVLTPSDYQHSAVIAARQVIEEKKWTDDLENEIEVKQKKDKAENEQYEQDIVEKAEYYKNIVEYKNQENSFQVRIADVPKFEGALEEKGIEFYREDKNIGVQIDTYPTQTYYFKDENFNAVDEISRNLKLVTTPYTDIKPFFGFEMKVLLIVLSIMGLLIIISKYFGA
jgi:hypothetical protein